MGDKYVITAASCTEGKGPSDLFVRVGDTSLDEEFEATSFTIGVAKITQHPGFNLVSHYVNVNSSVDSDYNYKINLNYDVKNENNIAVLELIDPLSLTEYPNIKPACLPEAGALFHGQATVTGWGSVTGRKVQGAGPFSASPGPKSASLNEVDMTVMADGDCEVLDVDLGSYHDQYFDDHNHYHDTLNLDMGEDLICVGSNDKGRLVFLMSFWCRLIV